nr:Wzz/FepE/Etk N-terminal domain-containing protein [uncultured Pedobacter sp.]
MVQESKNNKNTYNEEISLKDLILKFKNLWSYLLSNWVIIIVFSIVGGGIGIFYAYTRKPTYTSTTTFVLEDEKSGGGLSNLAGLASIAGIDLSSSGGGIFQGDNILELYKSRTMIERTLLTVVSENGRKQLLVDKYIDFNNLRAVWDKKNVLANLKFQVDSLTHGTRFIKPNRVRDSILGVIVGDINKNYLSVGKPDKKLSTIQVDVKSRNEFFAKTFNDELVKNVNEFYINTKTKKTLQNVKILQHKTDSVRGVMNGAIYTVAAVSDATPNLNPTRQVQRVVPVQRAQFSAETNKAIFSEMAKNLEITKMSLLKETPLIQIVDQPIYPLYVDKLSKLKGLIVGGILAGFLIVFYLVVKRVLKSIMS